MHAVNSLVSHDPGQTVAAHAAADFQDIARLRALSQRERAESLGAVCAAAVEIEQSRLAAGWPKTEPAPWPVSTQQFFRRHAADVRG